MQIFRSRAQKKDKGYGFMSSRRRKTLETQFKNRFNLFPPTTRAQDMDNIDEDLQAGKVEKLLAQPVDFDKAGLAQFYCVHCA